MVGYIYLSLLLLIIFFIVFLIIKNQKESPIKIKIFLNIIFLVLLIKNLVLFLNTVIDNQGISYLLRNCVFLDFIAIPMISVAMLYIFLRQEKLKFDYNYIYLVIMSLTYIISMIYCSKKIGIDSKLGFIILFENPMIPYLVYLIILSTISVVTLWFLDKPNNNKKGMSLLLLSICMYIMEFILIIGGMHIFRYVLVSEVFILITCYRGLDTFGKR